MKKLILTFLLYLSVYCCLPIFAQELDSNKHNDNYFFRIVNDKGEVLNDRELYIFDEEENIIAKWISDNNENGSLPTKDGKKVDLPIGKKLLFMSKEEPGIYIKSIEFSLDEIDVEETILELKEIEYQTIQFDTSFNDDSIKSEYTLYKNNKEEIVIDIYGNECIGKSFNVLKGNYFYKQTMLDDNYYLDNSLYEIEVNEDIQIEINPKPVFVYFKTINHNQEIELNTELSIFDELGNNIMTFKNQEDDIKIKLKRDNKYSIVSNKPNGFYKPNDIQISTSKYYEDNQEINIDFYPTNTIIYALDSQTNEKLDGAIWEIYDQNNNFIMEKKSSTDGTKITGLNADEEYIVKTKQSPESYYSFQQEIIKIPSKLDNDNSIQNIFYQGFVTLKISVKENVFNTLVEGSKYCLYKNGNVATDIYGNNIEGISSIKGDLFMIDNGNYELKIIESSKYSYSSNEIFPIEARHENGTYLETIAYEQPVLVRFTCLNKNNKLPVSDSTIQLLDKDKNIIGEWVSTNNLDGDYPSKDNQIIMLERNQTYYVFCSEIKENYYIKDKLIKFKTSEFANETIPNYKIDLIPFVNFVLNHSIGDGFEYTLYLDEACTNVAYDIENLPATTYFSNSNKYTFQMSEGTYWLKETKTKKNYWPNEIPIKIDLNQEKGLTQNLEIYKQQISLSVSIKNENDEMLVGAKLSLYTDDGDLIDSWISDSSEHIVNKESLYPNLKCILKEEKAPDGYKNIDASITYTIPSFENSDPSIEIRNEKIKETKSQKIINNLVETSKSSKNSLNYGVITIIVISLCGGIFYICLRKMKNFHKD